MYHMYMMTALFISHVNPKKTDMQHSHRFPPPFLQFNDSYFSSCYLGASPMHFGTNKVYNEDGMKPECTQMKVKGWY